MDLITRLEEAILVAILRLESGAFGVTINREVSRIFNKNYRMGALYFSLDQLYQKGLVTKTLAAFMAEQRTREIGIRRVLGASIPNITNMLSREFALLVAAANLIAWPAAYYTIGLWLRSFAVRAPFSPWTYIFSAGLGLAIALATVSFQAIRAATTDPVQALKYE